MTGIKDTLAERQATHGDFKHNAFIHAEVSRLLIDTAVRAGASLMPEQESALLHIAAKLGRIVSSPASPSVEEHWRDIAGYCELVLRGLRGGAEEPANEDREEW